MQSLETKRYLRQPTYLKRALTRLLECAVLAGGFWGNVYAQDSVQYAPSAPPAPVLTFRSAFSNYKMMTDEPVGNWRALNDAVGRIGGWRAYLNEAQQPDRKPGADDPSMVKPGAKRQTEPEPQTPLQTLPKPAATPTPLFVPDPTVRPSHQHGAK